MYRVLIALAVVVVAVALVGAVSVVIFRPGAAEPDDARPDVTQAESRSQPSAGSEPPPKSRPPVARDPQKPRAAVDEPAGESDGPPPEAVAPAAEPEVDIAEADTRTRISALLDGLSKEEQEELNRQLRDRRMRQWREQQKYALPSEDWLRVLRYRRDGALKLNEVQQQQIDEFREIMKPKIDAALQGIWAQEADLRNQARTMAEAGQSQEAIAVQQQLGELRRQTAEAKRQVDEEFQAMLQGILTPDQTAEINRMMQRTRGNRR